MPAEITAIGDHAGQALARLIEQYKESPKLRSLLSISCTQVQSLEDTALAVYTLRLLDNTTGVQLDGVGEIIGEARQGRGDDTYRTAILVRIAINSSGGTPEILIFIADRLANASRVQLREIYPANVEIYIEAESLPAAIRQLLQSATPAGVGNVILLHADTTPFVFGEANAAGDIVSEDPDGEGFAELGLYLLDLGDGDVLELDDSSLLGINSDTDDFFITDDFGGKLVELFSL
jgi:hypothetical protein